MAFAKARYGVPPPPEFTIDRYVAIHRVTLPLISYSEGQSYTRGGPIADHIRTSFVVCYGFGAIVVWQDKEWFPARSSRIRRLAETGY